MLAWLVPAAFAFDPTHAALQAVLDARLADGRVDYAGLRAAPAVLDGYLAEVARADVAAMSPADAQAFWIDAYNALTLDLVADAWPIGSIRDLDDGRVWDTRRFAVAGGSLTLNDIEQRRLRPLGDPRIHAALNCASRGCPPLSPRVFTGAGLSAQLDAAAARWVATARLAGGVLTVSRIFEWYADDFVVGYGPRRFDVPGLAGPAEAAANFVAAFDPARAGVLRAGGYTVAYDAYDWAVNAR